MVNVKALDSGGSNKKFEINITVEAGLIVLWKKTIYFSIPVFRQVRPGFVREPNRYAITISVLNFEVKIC